LDQHGFDIHEDGSGIDYNKKEREDFIALREDTIIKLEQRMGDDYESMLQLEKECHDILIQFKHHPN